MRSGPARLGLLALIALIALGVLQAGCTLGGFDLEVADPGHDGATCPSGMAFIAGGTFGSHTVEALCMDLTEVTVAAFGRAAKAKNKSIYTPGRERSPEGDRPCNARYRDRDDHPMNCVDWEQADAHCRSRASRLPTEWEWEWAARGRDKGWRFPWGEEMPTCTLAVMDDHGDGCGKDRTWPVGSKPAGISRDGLLDMAGNVWEWTSSRFGDDRVLRGGGWSNDYPEGISATSRSGRRPPVRNSHVGFRCVRTVHPRP